MYLEMSQFSLLKFFYLYFTSTFLLYVTCRMAFKLLSHGITVWSVSAQNGAHVCLTVMENFIESRPNAKIATLCKQ